MNELQTPLDFFVGRTGTSAYTILISTLRDLWIALVKRGNSDRWLAQSPLQCNVILSLAGLGVPYLKSMPQTAKIPIFLQLLGTCLYFGANRASLLTSAIERSRKVDIKIM